MILSARASKGLRKGCYSECLTRHGCYIVCCGLDPMRNLYSTTEAQGVLQDQGRSTLQGWLSTGSRDGLGKTRLGGFFFVCRKTDLSGQALRHGTVRTISGHRLLISERLRKETVLLLAGQGKGTDAQDEGGNGDQGTESFHGDDSGHIKRG